MLILLSRENGTILKDNTCCPRANKRLLLWNRKTGERHVVEAWQEAKSITESSVDALRDAYIGGIPCNDWFVDEPIGDGEEELV